MVKHKVEIKLSTLPMLVLFVIKPTTATHCPCFKTVFHKWIDAATSLLLLECFCDTLCSTGSSYWYLIWLICNNYMLACIVHVYRLRKPLQIIIPDEAGPAATLLWNSAF